MRPEAAGLMPFVVLGNPPGGGGLQGLLGPLTEKSGGMNGGAFGGHFENSNQRRLRFLVYPAFNRRMRRRRGSRAPGLPDFRGR